jgi:hypothetical protein
MTGWTELRPKAIGDVKGRELLLWCAVELQNCSSSDAVEGIRRIAFDKVDECEVGPDLALHLRICVSLFCDLRAQQWLLRSNAERIEAMPPDRDHLNVAEQKLEIRAGHLLERDAQLAAPATRRFIASMERRQPHGKGWHSIYSLMRDGRDLADKLRIARELPRGVERRQALQDAVDPYVQVADRDTRCEFTGFSLYDIWRYFRHTWSTAYRSVPGRQISFLIRDRSTANHPVIGIGALTSAVVQQQNRDVWIGWHASRFFDLMREDGYEGWPEWLDNAYQKLLGEIYLEDFLDEGLVSITDLETPSQEVVATLRRAAVGARDAHRLYPELKQHKAARPEKGVVDWVAQTKTQLYRSKRAATLADLVEARWQLLSAGFDAISIAALERALAAPLGRAGVKAILRKMKSSHVGVDTMDIAVCGAVAPYNTILGGKLVSMLMASPDVTSAYNERYSEAVSIIASSMAGREIRRPPRLVLLNTTSLYGAASSQYNRIRIPADEVGGQPGSWLEYVHLDKTSGYGLYHISAHTTQGMELLLARAQRGREVNSIFGEGVNPKMRKIRSALETLGLPSDLLLRHKSPRIVYSVPLASNFREVLLGRAVQPNYIVPQTPSATAAIADYWRKRWLDGRIDHPWVLEQASAHTLAYPVTHGARVPLPTVQLQEIGPLFGT